LVLEGEVDETPVTDGGGRVWLKATHLYAPDLAGFAEGLPGTTTARDVGIHVA
jgi:hypothetical protein